MDKELREHKLGKFTFRKDPWANSIDMEWIEESNYCMYPDDEKDLPIDTENAEALILFIASELNISLRDLAHRNGR